MTERPALSDYNQLLSFEERVFHVRFRQKVPKLYRDPAVCVDRHRVIRENGKIVADGTPKEIFENPTNERLKTFLSNINMLESADNYII